MIHITSSITICRPPARVFDFISASGNDFEWQYGTLASGQVSEGASRLGASFRTIGHLMGRRTQSTFEVTELDANHRYGYRSLSGPLNSHTVYTLVSVRGCTQVKVSTEVASAGSPWVLDSELERYMQKQLGDDLSLLKTILEAG